MSAEHFPTLVAALGNYAAVMGKLVEALQANNILRAPEVTQSAPPEVIGHKH